MAFEFKIFGAPVQFGTFGFFDLMDTVPAAAVVETATDVVIDFQVKPARAHVSNDASALKTAA